MHNNQQDIEIEIKFPLHNPDEVTAFLNTHANLISEHVYQKDDYYVPHHRDFLAVQYPFEWLRLRESPKGMFVTYKHYYPENAHHADYCDEFETQVESLDAMEKIFTSLDLKCCVTVEKTRTTWMLQDTEIVIDNVVDLGCYMELEAKKSFDDPKDGKTYLYEVLHTLNARIGEQCFKGYPYIILENKGYTFGR